MRANENLLVQKLSEINNLKVHGRTTGELSPLTLFWTGSGLELNAKGTELWIEVEADYDIYEPWISILINSAPVSRQMVTVGRHWICVYRGMNQSAIKNIRIVRDVQAMSADASCCLQIHAVKSDGAFMPIENKQLKIEFIGDSITSGEGCIGSRQEEDWISMWFSAVDNYTAMTAQVLDADYRVVAQSGWGIMTRWDNNPVCNIPLNYEKICGVLCGEKNQALGAFNENDFASWQTDIVVINLGTNDGGAFTSPEWKDESTGKIYKQRLNKDGTFNEEDINALKQSTVEFLKKLRKYNSKAHLVWAYGMLGTLMLPAIKSAIEAYSKITGDTRISLLELPNMSDETVGARQHPGPLAHKAAAQVLTEHIKGII